MFVSLSATHVSESVPGSVLVELSHGAQPFVVTVTGDRRFSAQQESHGREEQREEHLLEVKTERGRESGQRRGEERREEAAAAAKCRVKWALCRNTELRALWRRAGQDVTTEHEPTTQHALFTLGVCGARSLYRAAHPSSNRIINIGELSPRQMGRRRNPTSSRASPSSNLKSN